jgi:hypothetical protein
MELIIIFMLVLVVFLQLLNNKNEKQHLNNNNIKLNYTYKISVISNNITSVYNLYSNTDFYKLKHKNYTLTIKIIDEVKNINDNVIIIDEL